MNNKCGLRCTRWAVAVILTVFIAMMASSIAMAKTTLSIWVNSYTPSRLVPGSQRVVEGIDPAVKAYEQLHPDIDIEIVQNPMGEERTWLITQLTGGTAPHISWTQPDWVNEDVGKGWWVNFDPYLAEKNPYAPEYPDWRSIFYPAIEVWRAADDHLYMLLGDQVQVGFYYNKDFFDRYGISIPSNWEDLMEAAETLDENGVAAFAMAGNDLNQVTWISGWLTNFYYYSLVPEYDTNGDDWVSKEEISRAVKDGTYSFLQDRNIERLETLKRMYQYAQRGFVGADRDIARRLFVTGRAGMYIATSGDMQEILANQLRRFDLGIFYFPPLDSETSSLIADGIPSTNKAAGYGSLQLAVTNRAVQDGVVDQAMDFLKFLTAPENASPIIKEGGFALPNIQGAEANPDLEPFAESISYPAASLQEDDSMFDYEFAQKFLAVINPYLTGEISVDVAASRLQAYAEEAAGRVLAITQ